MKKAELKNSLNNLVDYLALRYTSLGRPGGKYMRAQEKRMTKKLKFYFTKQMKWLIEKLADIDTFKNTDEEGKKVRFIETKAVEEDINELLEKMPFTAEIVETMVAYSGGSMVKGGNYRIRKMKIGKFVGTFSLQTPEVKRYLDKMAELQLSNYRGAISRTTKDEIRKIVIKGAEEGASYSRVSKLIQEQGESGVFSQARGELISTREVGKAYGTGQDTVVNKYVKETGAIVVKDWLTAGDDKVREDHKRNEEAGEIPLNDLFPGTDESFAPSDDFGCRCVSNYRTI